MLRKLFRRNNNSLIFALLTLALVFFFRFFLKEDFQQRDFWKIFIFYFGAFFLLPWGVIRFIYRERLENFFLKRNALKEMEEKKKYFFWIIFWIGVFLLVMLKFGQWKEFPVSSWILGRWDLVIFLDLSFLPLILFFQEFFYRGFVLKTFSEKMGPWWAIGGQAGLAIMFDLLFVRRFFLVSGLLFLFYYFLGWVSLKNKNFLASWWVIFFVSLIFDAVVRYKISELVLNN